MLNGQLKTMSKVLNVVGLIIISTTYIYIITLGALYWILILLIIIDVLLILNLFWASSRSRKKLIILFTGIALVTFLYISQNGISFLINQWESSEDYINSKFNETVLFTYFSLSSGFIWTSIFSFFLNDKQPARSDFESEP